MLAWFHWWWDPNGLARAEVVVGAFGVVLAALAIWYAWRVARRQFQVMDEQTAISKEQMRLAAQQDKIINEQINRKTDLRLRATGCSTKWSSGDKDSPPTFVEFKVINRGNKTADGFHWELFVSRDLQFLVQFVNDEDEKIEGIFSPFSQAEQYDKIEGHYPHKLFTGSSVPVARVAVKANHPRTQSFVLKWRIHCEDGAVPSDGLAEIGLKAQPKGTYAFYNADPGTKVNPDAPVVKQG